MARDKVSMPMASAGIIGASSDINIGGFEIDPKVVIVAVFALVVIIVAAGMLIG